MTTRRWRSIMHGQVHIYEELSSPQACTWHPVASIVLTASGTFVPTVRGRTLRVCFGELDDARWLIENRLSRGDDPAVAEPPIAAYAAMAM